MFSIYFSKKWSSVSGGNFYPWSSSFWNSFRYFAKWKPSANPWWASMETGKYFLPSRILNLPKVTLGTDSVLSKSVGCNSPVKEVHGRVECRMRSFFISSLFNRKPFEFWTALISSCSSLLKVSKSSEKLTKANPKVPSALLIVQPACTLSNNTPHDQQFLISILQLNWSQPLICEDSRQKTTLTSQLTISSTEISYMSLRWIFTLMIFKINGRLCIRPEDLWERCDYQQIF